MADLLAIYLNDHLAASAGGVALARRIAGSREGAEGEETGRLAQQVEEDRATLAAAARRLGVRRTRYKESLAIAAERVGRLKPNGALVRRSPLSDVVEYEALAVAVAAKRRLWLTLRGLAATRAELDEAELDELARRADHQLEIVERLHSTAVAKAFEAA
jgi:hypothetical protein